MLPQPLLQAVEELLETSLGSPASISSTALAGGGCINNACALRLDDGRSFFLKWNAAPLPAMFEREAEGLAALAGAGAIRVPEPIGTGGESGSAVPPYILMEHIPVAEPGPGFFEEFGRQFAELHQNARGERFGFEHDNFLGSTPQPNDWTDNWVDFWRERRLGFQLALARRQGRSDREMERLGDRLMDRLNEFLAEPDESPCLLHGDLWSGNYLADDRGRPVLIDPAAYYGRREADLAMTMLFGGFSASFYKSYEEVWPLTEGSAARLDIYKLYHLLNHLNLFGSGYYSGCIQILRRYAG